MAATPARRRRSFRLFQVAGTLLVAALSAASWYAWLGWNDSYRLDPATGSVSGPYQSRQVVGAALTLLVVLVAALLAGVRPVPAGTALTVSFTAAWASTWATRSGLLAIGVVLSLVGLALGSAVVSGVVHLARRVRATDSRSAEPPRERHGGRARR
ncbi:hypothetical protein [Micromonospora sp. NPDC051006]|uniref:hypothetical protein n=1 Tax=Micromonospora sp. NPDC051006 TaxID=3364283 RepID=UPI0037B50003